MNVLVMRAFVHLRRAQGQYAELRSRIEDLARQIEGHNELLTEILSFLEALESSSPRNTRPIGFRPPTVGSDPSAQDRKISR